MFSAMLQSCLVLNSRATVKRTVFIYLCYLVDKRLNFLISLLVITKLIKFLIGLIDIALNYVTNYLTRIFLFFLFYKRRRFVAKSELVKSSIKKCHYRRPRKNIYNT